MKNLILDWPAAGIARLTLSQPKRRNALTAAMWQAIPDLLKELVKDKSLRVLIVTGNGDPVSYTHLTLPTILLV